MKILFLHRDFPGQFKFLITILKAIGAEIHFVTEEKNINLDGINKYTYSVQNKPNPKDSFLIRYENILKHAEAAARVVLNLKNKGFEPDLIYGFSPWGLHLFLKDIFPDVPVISYCEWFYNAKGADIGFDGTQYSWEKLSELRLKNSNLLVDLYSSDYCISPTQWQKTQFPKEFHDKIKVIHDGIDCNFHKPNENAVFEIPEKNLEFIKNDEVITYVARGFEPYRGFEQVMKAIERLQEKRPNAHFILAGFDKACYGPGIAGTSYKEKCLKEMNIDSKKVHFTGILKASEYAKLLQISTVHIYMTYPFILSWSFTEALATGCCIVASDTAPVKEVIKDGENGLLVDFFDTEDLVRKVCYAIENKGIADRLRKGARQTALENYDVKIVMPKHVNMINEIIQNKNKG